MLNRICYKMMKSLLASIIFKFIDLYYHLKARFIKKNQILIIPHATMCSTDHYDIINYKSESALTFLHFILENNLQVDVPIAVAIADNVDVDIYKRYVSEKYPERKISFVTFFFYTKKVAPLDKVRNRQRHHDCIIHSSHIFSGTTYNLQGLVSKDQLLYNLNYYTASMKNDIFKPGDPVFIDYAHTGCEYTYTFLPSEMSIRLSLAEYKSIPYWNFKKLGLCRNDSLLDGEDCSWLRDEISKKVTYPLKTLVLYTPTHRDAGVSRKENDSALGFTYDAKRFELFLRDNGIVIYCKLHPRHIDELMNDNSKLPEGIIIHESSEKYGLCEMMQASDVLLTDYTSGYFDYLLLDKPVIFNLYDIETYKATRGLPYDPYDSVIAGDIVMNEEELKTALISLDNNSEKYKEKRSFLRSLFFTYIDGNTCKRVYDFIYNSEQAK